MNGVGITYLWTNKEFPPFVRLEGKRGDYEVYVPERTCRIKGRYGNQYCTYCGEMIGTWDSESELYISGNMVELWNYCPNCGAKVVSE